MTSIPDPNFDFPEELLIAYPRFKELYYSILDCQEMTRSTGDPHCLAIVGDLGVGKSTLVKAFVKASLKDLTRTKAEPSGIYVATPESKHEAAIATAILDQLGDPYPEKGLVWAQKHRIKKRIKKLDVSTVCFDDFQHLWDMQRDKPLYKESQWVKTLIKETNKTLVVTGIGKGIARILDANDELSSLFVTPQTLEPFKWDQENADEFHNIVSIIESQIGLPILVAITREELLGRIHYATDGVARHLFRLLWKSALFARRDGKECIDMTHLSKAYEDVLSGHFKHKKNPFT